MSSSHVTAALVLAACTGGGEQPGGSTSGTASDALTAAVSVASASAAPAPTGSGGEACAPTVSAVTPAEVEKRAAGMTGDSKIPASKLTKYDCNGFAVMLISNGFTSEQYFFRNGKNVGFRRGTDSGQSSCAGEVPDFPCK